MLVEDVGEGVEIDLLAVVGCALRAFVVVARGRRRVPEGRPAFVDLERVAFGPLCAAEDFVRAEFEAIIAAGWPDPPAEEPGDLAALIEYIRTSRGFDFSGYKPTSVGRRVVKRMGEVGCDSFADYQDPARVNWGQLRVWNDDAIAPKTGTGFIELLVACG